MPSGVVGDYLTYRPLILVALDAADANLYMSSRMQGTGERYPLPGLGGCQLANFRIHNAPGDPMAFPLSFLNTAIALSGKRQVVQEKANRPKFSL